MPDIQPDFDAPGASGIIQIASWALGLGLIVTLIALVACFVTIAFKGFGNQSLQQGASKSILWVLAGVAALGSLSAIWSFAVGFDLGL